MAKKEKKETQDNTCCEQGFMLPDPSFPYCAGCGHTPIAKALDSALKKLGKDPKEITITSDIGCVGLVDRLFETNTVHTTHGRSTAFATGLELADKILFDSDTTQIVMIGDGGATIGLPHLIEAARSNIDLSVILHNNFLYGMTGGQSSGLTPLEFRTSTSLDGNFFPPLPIVETLRSCRAGFLARKHATDKDLDDVLLEAFRYQGFSLVEVIELCTGYASKWNKMGRSKVEEMLQSMNSDKMGILENTSIHPPLSSVYKNNFRRQTFVPKDSPILVTETATLDKAISLVVAGTAGEGVQFASKLCLLAAVSRGLNVVQKNDNPVTVGSGFSVSEITLSSSPILYSGIESPDYIVITSEDGLKRISAFIENASENTLILLDDSLEVPKTKAKLLKKPIRTRTKHKRQSNIAALGCLLNYLDELTLESIEQSVNLSGKKTDAIMDALRIGHSLGK